ncbi:MAG: transporter [Deltaproteobacteria bacterium]|nr:transporter [Deltaproteobacteria bacterium]
MKTIFIIELIVAVSAWGRTVHAYRPFAVEDAGVAGKKTAQLEVSWDYLKWENGDQESFLLLVPVYGVTSWLEMSLEIPWMFHDIDKEDVHAGIGDISTAAKFLLLNEKKKCPSVVLKGVVKTNSGNADHGLGSGDLDYGVVAAASKTFGRFTLHAMFGYTFVGDNNDPDIRNIFGYGLAADYGVTEKFHVVAEVNGKRHPDRTVNRQPLDGLLGVIYTVSDHVTLDGGVRIGFNDSVPDVNTTLGATFTF